MPKGRRRMEDTLCIQLEQYTAAYSMFSVEMKIGENCNSNKICGMQLCDSSSYTYVLVYAVAVWRCHPLLYFPINFRSQRTFAVLRAVSYVFNLNMTTTQTTMHFDSMRSPRARHKQNLTIRTHREKDLLHTDSSHGNEFRASEQKHIQSAMACCWGEIRCHYFESLDPTVAENCYFLTINCFQWVTELLLLGTRHSQMGDQSASHSRVYEYIALTRCSSIPWIM